MDNLALLPVFIALTKKKNKPSAQREYINYACVAGSGNGLIREKLVRKSSHIPSLTSGESRVQAMVLFKKLNN